MNQELRRAADEHLVEENDRLLGILRCEEAGLRLAADIIAKMKVGLVPDLDGAPSGGDVGEWTDWLIQRGAFQVFSAPAAQERLFEEVAA